MKFLRSLIGPSKAEAWKDIADQLGSNATFEKKGFWSNSKIFYNYKNWHFVIKTISKSNGNSSSNYTILKVPFVTNNHLRFNFSHEGIFSSMGKHINITDIEINDSNFDKTFYIKGSNPPQIKRIFADDSIKKLMFAFEDIDISIRDDDGLMGTNLPSNVNFLHFEYYGTIKDFEIINDMISLISKLLDRLVEIGSAQQYYPNVKLD